MAASIPVPALPAAAAPARTGRRPRFLVLLVALLAMVLVEGMLPPGDVERILSTALAGATLVLSLRVGDARASLVRGAAAVAVVLVAATVAQAVAGHVADLATNLAGALLVALAPPAVVVGVVRAMRRQQRIPAEAVVGVLCLYILFGLFFAFVWAVLNRVDAPFFGDDVASHASEYVYFSFVTLTTVGYGDLTPRTPVGHTLAVLEALLGQIYLVTVVSLIVSNVGRERQRRD